MKIALNMKARLTLWFLLIMITVLLFFSGLAYFLLGNGLMQSEILPLHTRLVRIETVDDGINLAGTVTGISEEDWESRQTDLVVNVQLDSEQLSKIKESGMLLFSLPQGQLTLNAEVIGPHDSYSKIQLYVYRSPEASGSYELVITQQSNTNINKQLQIFLRSLYIIIPVSLLVAGLLWFLLVRQLLYPLEAITKATREMQEDSLDKRLPVSGKDELARLADSMNRMFERLERSMTREKQFAADASHELRTPLTIIAGEVSRALGGVTVDKEQNRRLLEKISLQADRMAALLQKLRFLEQDERTLRLSFADMDLSVLLREIDSDMQPFAQSKQISLFIRTTESCPIKGDPALLRSLFFNLLDNAFKHTSPGGEIRLVMLKDENKIIVSARDNGSGIPEQHLPHIFERFYRVHKTRDGGMGLGLAICKKILDVHYGGISVTSHTGKGTTFIITLPCL